MLGYERTQLESAGFEGRADSEPLDCNDLTNRRREATANLLLLAIRQFTSILPYYSQHERALDRGDP